MALWIEGLRVAYGRRVVVEDLSIAVPDGSITGFLGHNGAGKTSAMRGILGLVPVRAGRILVDGIDARRDPAAARGRVGSLIETTSFPPGWTARANLFHLARLAGADRRTAAADADRRLEQVGLASVGGQRPASFSQGMRQRLGLAQALLGGRTTLLLDEPTNGLDPEGIAELSAVLARLRDEEGAAILLSSHLLSEVEELCDHVAILREGRLVASGSTEALLAGVGAPHRAVVRDPAAALGVLEEAQLKAEQVDRRLDFELGDLAPDVLLRRLVEADVGVERFGPQPRTLVGLYARATAGELAPTPLEPPAADAADSRRSVRGGLGRVFRYELARQRRGAWILLLPALLAVGAIARMRARTSAARAEVEAEGLFSATEPTAFAAVAEGLSAALPAASLIVGLAASLAVAGDLGRGTLRNLAVRSITRIELVLGKALVALLIAVAAWSATALAALSAAAAWFDFGDLEEILITGDRFPLMSAAEVRPELDLALAGSLAALPAVAAIGFLVGCLARRGVVAVVFALLVHQLLDGARALGRSGGWEWLLPTSYLPSPLGDSSRVGALALLADGATNAPFEFASTEWFVPLGWTLAALGLAVPLVLRRNIH